MEEFFSALSDITRVHGSAIFGAFSVFTRLSLFVFLMPGIGEEKIPLRFRLLFAVLLSVSILPLLWEDISSLNVTVVQGTLLIAKEALIGFLLGFSLRMFIFILQIAGNIIAQSLSISQVLGEGINSEPNTTISTLLILSGVAFFFSTNLHLEALGLFINSFEYMPLNYALDMDAEAYKLSQMGGFVFKFSISLSAGFLILNLLYNGLLGFVNRAMPQLMVTFVGLPLITWVGLMLFTFSVGTILGLWQASLASYIDSYPVW